MPKWGWKCGWGGGCWPGWGKPGGWGGKCGWGGCEGGCGGPTIPLSGGTEVSEVTGLEDTVEVTAEFDVENDSCWCCCCATCAWKSKNFS